MISIAKNKINEIFHQLRNWENQSFAYPKQKNRGKIGNRREGKDDEDDFNSNKRIVSTTPRSVDVAIIPFLEYDLF